MKYTFEELKRVWREYRDLPDGAIKTEKWILYCMIRDYLEAERKGLRQIDSVSEPTETH